MMKFRFNGDCPRCGTKTLTRMERKKWMHYVPGSKYYRCGKCRTRFIVVMDWLAWKVK